MVAKVQILLGAPNNASMVKLVNTLGLGPSDRKVLWVRLPLLAPNNVVVVKLANTVGLKPIALNELGGSRPPPRTKQCSSGGIGIHSGSRSRAS